MRKKTTRSGTCFHVKHAEATSISGVMNISICTFLQGNVKESKYDVDFFKSFDVVMNGLDNLEARRHVNRLCLAAETPLIESGTAGYLGQVWKPQTLSPLHICSMHALVMPTPICQQLSTRAEMKCCCMTQKERFNEQTCS